MKLKFINPIFLFRCKNCFKIDEYTVFDPKVNETTSIRKNISIYSDDVTVLYTDSELKKIDFDEYYNLNMSLKELLELEESGGAFSVRLFDDAYESGFIALKNRLYYEVYDDNLTLIK